MKLACWKCIFLMASVAFLMLSSSDVFANSASAKVALSQNTTNSFCSAGYNDASPFDASEIDKKNQFKNSCPPGMSYVECLRQSWKQAK